MILIKNIEYIKFTMFFIFMAAASVSDIKTGKIPNRLVLTGGIIGIIFTIFFRTDSNGLGMVWVIAWMIAELAILFGYGMFGFMSMGDIKLWMMATTFITLRYSAMGMVIGELLLIAYGFVKHKKYIPQIGYPLAPFMTVGMIIVEILRFINVR